MVSYTWLSLAHLVRGSHKDMSSLIRVRNRNCLESLQQTRNSHLSPLPVSLSLGFSLGSIYSPFSLLSGTIVPGHNSQQGILAECQQFHTNASSWAKEPMASLIHTILP